MVVLLVPKPDGRTDKIPLNPTTAMPADAHAPVNWTTRKYALAQAAAWDKQCTVGFVLTAADQFWCLDIDGCRQADGTLSPLAHELMQSLPGCAIEVSQSGKGLHIWGQGPVPPHSKKNVPLHIELYSDLRFIAAGHPDAEVTGDMTQPCTAIADVVARYFTPSAAGAGTPGQWDNGPCPEWRGPTDDDDLLRRAIKSSSAAAAFSGKATFSHLWDADADAPGRTYPADAGSTEPYVRSSADAALASLLAFWTGEDAERIERLMRRSGLMRDKWDDRAD